MKARTKIRINELARELEIKAQAILEMLPEVGIKGKKTHSSSLDGAQADLVRGSLKKKEEGEAEEPDLHVEAPSDTIASVRSADAKAQVSAQPRQKTPSKPAIPSGGGMPLRPPIQALRPPLRKPSPSTERPAAKPSPQRSVTPAGQAMPGAPVGRSPKRPTAPAPPVARAVKPIPSEVAAGGVAPRGPRAPLAAGFGGAATQESGASLGAPIRPPVSGAPSDTASARMRRPAAPVPGAAGPGQPTARTARQTGQPARKPVLVPGQPIYQRPKRGPSLPGMPGRPSPRPGGRLGHAATKGVVPRREVLTRGRFGTAKQSANSSSSGGNSR